MMVTSKLISDIAQRNSGYLNDVNDQFNFHNVHTCPAEIDHRPCIISLK